MSELFAPSPGQPFNVEQNKVRNSVATTWTAVGPGPVDRPISVYGVQWDGASGSSLQLRDRDGDIWYTRTSEGGTGIDLFITPLPLYNVIEYFDSSGSNTIIIYGVYM